MRRADSVGPGSLARGLTAELFPPDDAPGPKERVSRTQFRAVSRDRQPLTVTRDSSQGSFLYC